MLMWQAGFAFFDWTMEIIDKSGVLSVAYPQRHEAIKLAAQPSCFLTRQSPRPPAASADTQVGPTNTPAPPDAQVGPAVIRALDAAGDSGLC